MSVTIWGPFLFGFVAVLVVMLLRLALRRQNPREASAVGDVRASPSPWSARILYWTWFVGFLVVLFPADSIAQSMLPPHAQERSFEVALLFTGIWWLVWGFVPAAVIMSLGSERFDAFKAAVAYHGRSSFRSFVVLWLTGSAVMIGVGAWALAN